MATVLIIGASKGIGLLTVKTALKRGHAVRALARSADAIGPDEPGLQKISADARDKAAVGAALIGADAVILCLGSQITFKPVTLFSAATRVLVDAMNTLPVKRLIVVTGIGAGDSRGVGSFAYTAVLFPLLLKRIYDDKDVQEQIVRNSGLAWTIVRPGILTNAPATGRYRVLVDKGKWTNGLIPRADVAAFLVDQITDASLVGKTPLLIT